MSSLTLRGVLKAAVIGLVAWVFLGFTLFVMFSDYAGSGIHKFFFSIEDGVARGLYILGRGLIHLLAIVPGLDGDRYLRSWYTLYNDHYLPSVQVHQYVDGRPFDWHPHMTWAYVGLYAWPVLIIVGGLILFRLAMVMSGAFWGGLIGITAFRTPENGETIELSPRGIGTVVVRALLGPLSIVALVGGLAVVFILAAPKVMDSFTQAKQVAIDAKHKQGDLQRADSQTKAALDKYSAPNQVLSPDEALAAASVLATHPTEVGWTQSGRLNAIHNVAVACTDMANLERGQGIPEVTVAGDPHTVIQMTDVGTVKAIHDKAQQIKDMLGDDVACGNLAKEVAPVHNPYVSRFKVLWWLAYIVFLGIAAAIGAAKTKRRPRLKAAWMRQWWKKSHRGLGWVTLIFGVGGLFMFILLPMVYVAVVG